MKKKHTQTTHAHIALPHSIARACAHANKRKHMHTHIHTGLVRAADRPGQEVAATISLKHVYEIARVKHQDMPDAELQAVCKSILRTCKSMGVQVVRSPEDAVVR